MDFKELLRFLKQLSAHNEREWFHEHKTVYDHLKVHFENFVNLLIPRIVSFDQSLRIIPAKDCIFRIFRDTRFSKDKTPYKTNFGAYIASEGRKSAGAGYYLHIEPSNSFLAGGVYMPSPEMLKAIRMEILYNYDEFQSIINQKAFIKYFGEVHTYEKLSRYPKGFPADFKGSDYFRYKSFVMLHGLEDKDITTTDLIESILPVYKAMLPFNQFLRRASENIRE